MRSSQGFTSMDRLEKRKSTLLTDAETAPNTSYNNGNTSPQVSVYIYSICSILTDSGCNLDHS